AAAAAGGEPRAGPLGAGAEAGAAVFRPLEGDGLLAPERRLLEVDLQRVAHVAPGRLAPAREPEQIAGERPGDVDRPEPVVVHPLLLVGEDGVGDRQLLELLLRRLVAGVAIGVPAQRQLAIRRLDLDLGRAAVDLQRPVVVGGQTNPRPILVSPSAPSTPRPARGAAGARRRDTPSAARRRPRPPGRRRSPPVRPPRAAADRTVGRLPRTV